MKVHSALNEFQTTDSFPQVVICIYMKFKSFILATIQFFSYQFVNWLISVNYFHTVAIFEISEQVLRCFGQSDIVHVSQRVCRDGVYLTLLHHADKCRPRRNSKRLDHYT